VAILNAHFPMAKTGWTLGGSQTENRKEKSQARGPD
jgi:hypothetical protein